MHQVSLPEMFTVVYTTRFVVFVVVYRLVIVEMIDDAPLYRVSLSENLSFRQKCKFTPEVILQTCNFGFDMRAICTSAPSPTARKANTSKL